MGRSPCTTPAMPARTCQIGPVASSRSAERRRCALAATCCWWASVGGFGDGLLDALNRAGVHLPLLKIALSEGFVHHGAVDDLRRQQRIDADGILEQVRQALGLPAATSAKRVRSKASAA